MENILHKYMNGYFCSRGVLKLKGHTKTTDSMGNCIQAYIRGNDPIPRTSIINVNIEPLKDCNFPIVFLLGGPGSGKRTLCMKLAEKYGFLHILASEVIRQEIMTRTERAFKLARMMSQGQLVPTDILIELIAIKMLNNLYNKNGVIVSGFPKRKEQCRIFDTEIRPPDLVLYLNVRNSVLSDRIMGRIMTTTERPTTSYEEIKNEIKKFHKRNRPIMKHYKERLINIDGEFDAIKVYEDACNAIDNVLMKTSSTV